MLTAVNDASIVSPSISQDPITATKQKCCREKLLLANGRPEKLNANINLNESLNFIYHKKNYWWRPHRTFYTFSE